jgi:putative membrane protein
MTADSAASEHRFEVRTTSDSHFGWLRTRMALERTFLAWVRTGVSLVGFGFTIVVFFEHLQGMKGVVAAERPHAPRTLGLLLIGAGVLTLIISSLQYRKLVHYLWSQEFRVLAGVGNREMRAVIVETPAYAVSILVALIGLFAFIAVWVRLV